MLHKGKTSHDLYRQVVFIRRFLCFYFINEGVLKSDLYLQGGLYSEVTLNTGLTVVYKPIIRYTENV